MIGSYKRAVVAVAMIAATAGAMTGCGSAGASSTSTASAGGPAAEQSLPASIRSSGVLRVGTNVPTPPMEMYADDGKTFAGIDMDLISAIASKLGLRAEITNSNWDGLIPALKANRYDILASSFADLTNRHNSADFIDMLNGGAAGIVGVGDATKYPDKMSLCGKRVAVESGSGTVAIAKTLSAACQNAGKPAIAQDVFPQDTDALVALQSGRVDVVFDDKVVAEYVTSTQPARYQVVLPDLSTPFKYGFAVSKDSQQLTNAVAATLNELIADGTYAKICAKYGISGDVLVNRATINEGASIEGGS